MNGTPCAWGLASTRNSMHLAVDIGSASTKSSAHIGSGLARLVQHLHAHSMARRTSWRGHCPVRMQLSKHLKTACTAMVS